MTYERRALAGALLAMGSAGQLALTAILFFLYGAIPGRGVDYASGPLALTGPFVFAWCMAAVSTVLIGAAGYFILRRFAERLAARAEHSEYAKQMILEQVDEVIVTVDDRGIIHSFNLKAENLFGYRPDEVIGKNLDVLVTAKPGSDAGAYVADLLRRCQSNPSVRDRDVTGRRKDGVTFPMNLGASDISGEDGRIYAVIMHDMTVEKSVQAQLTHAQKMESIGQLAAGIAHEINTPIQYVGDNTRFIQENITDVLKLLGILDSHLAPDCGPDQREEGIRQVAAILKEMDVDFIRAEMADAISQTLEGIECVSNIVRAMKGFSHPGTDLKSPADLNQAIENTITVCRNRWKYTAEIETDFAADLPMVPCLMGEFNQVILNLIINATDAIEEAKKADRNRPGLITVKTRRDGDWVEIRIGDTGGGIPEKIIDKIFDPFFTTKDVGKGTGQGLTICHDVVVSKHGGTIDIDTSPGVGTTFTIRIPVRETAQGRQREVA